MGARPSTEASMFANLENSKNHYFIQRNQPVNRLLVATGYPKYQVSRRVEVIDLDNPSKTCILSADFPYDLGDSVGGFTSSGPMVCSGGWYEYSRSADCYSLA